MRKLIGWSLGLALIFGAEVCAQTSSIQEDEPFVSMNRLPEFLEAHRKSYFLVGSWDQALRDRPSPTPGGQNKRVEAKFQISFRYLIHDWGDDNRWRWDFAYTGTSFWQLYATDDSSPFRTTDHEPELFVERRYTDLLSGRCGVAHQSNGESGLSNRSWNRVFLEGLCSNPRSDLTAPRTWGVSLKTWTVFGEATENEDISDFMGPFELRGDYLFSGEREARFSAMLRNNLWIDSHNRGAFELNFAFNLFENFRLLVQYFNGYGESLLDYNDNANRIGIGFEFTP